MPLPVATMTTFVNNLRTLATPTVGMPRTQTCVGGSSTRAEVQSPARETNMRYPVVPGEAGTLAKWCQPAKGRRLIGRVVPTAGLVP
ncbi:MAG: hypothetical protein JWR34_1248 [Mycobacterium sp.]|nr:hypothetical protein [Mycobacterium sp.]